MAIVARNIFLPVQLCQDTGILVACTYGTAPNLACTASLRLRQDQRNTATVTRLRSALAQTSASHTCLFGLLTRGEDLVLVAHAKQTLDFCIQINEYGKVVQSSVRHPSTKATVVLYDASELQRTPSFHESDVNALVGWLLECQRFRVPSSVACLTDVVYANASQDGISFLWTPAICLGFSIKTANLALISKLPHRAVKFLSTCAQATSTGSLICKRLDDFVGLADSVLIHKRVTLRYRNKLCALLLDVVLGVWLACFVHWENGFSKQVPWASLEWTEHVVQDLQSVVKWLMGAPAGLKLNAQLNNALGSFFLYHISLWRTYVGVLDPWVGALLSLWPGSLTLHLALASDLLALSTVHVYCFYGYACRLYQGWLLALGALWRLFRGRKWNPLRKRVDSHHFDRYQQALGTMLFGVLFFLFPTAAVYYAVFLTLRLVVLCVQGFLSRAVLVWDSLPIYSLAARALTKHPVVGDIRFDAESYGPEFALRMRVIKGKVELLPEPLGIPSFNTVLADILAGRIIYPL